MGLAALAVGSNDRGTGAEVDLGLVAWLALEASEGQFAGRLQAADEATDGVVAPGEAVLGDQVLVDPLGGEAGRTWTGSDSRHGSQSLRATAMVPDAGWNRARRRDQFDTVPRWFRAGGRIGWFWISTERVPSRRAHWLVLAPPWPA